LRQRSRYPYGALLLASGAEPVRLTIPVSALPQVHYLRRLAESRALIAKATAARPMETLFGPEVGDLVRSVHEAHGVAFRLGTKPFAIDKSGVALDSGERIAANLVVVGIGVRPETALATGAGLTVDRGILVDALLETSTPGIWAAGDVARWTGSSPNGRVRPPHGRVRPPHAACWVRANRFTLRRSFGPSSTI
jgi:apoptosis-inducing factor 3